MKQIALIVTVLAVFLPISVNAETVLRIGDNISVESDQTVENDYYVSVGPFGNTTMSGTVNEDMYAFGGSVTVNGSVGKDLTIIGGGVQVHASTSDDVRIVGGDVTIAEHVGGDLFVIGGVLTMLSSATVDGDIFFFGGSAEINGIVGGSVLGTSEKIRIDAEVGGNVDVKTATKLTLGEKANIQGFVRYASLDELVRAQNATVEGEISQNDYFAELPDTQAQMRATLIPIFITLFATLFLYLLFKRPLQALVGRIGKAPLKSGLIGIGVLILGPIVSLLLMVTVLGLLVGFISFALVLLAYTIGFALSAVILGAYLSKLFTNHFVVSLPWLVVGAILLHLFLFVPVVGLALLFAVVAITVGGLTLSVYAHLS